MYIMFTITLERMLNIMLEFYKKKMLISNIDYLLRERHMTASQLEELIGVSNGYLSRLAVNDSEPGIDVVCTIARYLHIALEELMCLNLVKRSEKEEKVIFGGRLGQYQYFDMAPIIEQVMKLTEELFDK